MFAHIPVQTAKQHQWNVKPSSWAVRESEAKRNAEQFQHSGQNRLRATPLQADAVETSNDIRAGAGQSLAPAQRQIFETKFGHDFSQVRVHTDAQAAQLADEASAQAFTTGRHIVFGAGQFKPGTPEGAALMAHELTHVAQQSGTNSGEAGATQLEPKPGKKGIGAAQPSEPVVIAKGVAPEDNFVLFDQDGADISPASEKKLAQMFAAYSTPVTVELHGYASREGDTDYNSNLSGHRVVAAKAKLIALLPPGSQVVLYAHGETQAFGAATDNRRVGIKVVLDATPDPAKDTFSQGKTRGTAKGRDTMSFDPIDPSMSKPSIPGGGGLTLGGLPTPSTTLLTLSPNLTLPPLRPPSLLDWSDLRTPFTSRGLRLSDRDAQVIEQNWWTTYNFLRSLGLRPDLASLGANKGTAYAYDKMLSRESPNVVDLFDLEWEKTRSILKPGEKEFRTPIVPILTPTTLEWMSKTFFNKDWKFTF